MKKWTEDDVARMICNPVYAGVGPFPAIVSDEQWIEAMSKVIQQHGPARCLRLMLEELRSTWQADIEARESSTTT